MTWTVIVSLAVGVLVGFLIWGGSAASGQGTGTSDTVDPERLRSCLKRNIDLNCEIAKRCVEEAGGPNVNIGVCPLEQGTPPGLDT